MEYFGAKPAFCTEEATVIESAPCNQEGDQVEIPSEQEHPPILLFKRRLLNIASLI